jgi:hypothetical protein
MDMVLQSSEDLHEFTPIGPLPWETYKTVRSTSSQPVKASPMRSPVYFRLLQNSRPSLIL